MGVGKGVLFYFYEHNGNSVQGDGERTWSRSLFGLPLPRTRNDTDAHLGSELFREVQWVSVDRAAAKWRRRDMAANYVDIR